MENLTDEEAENIIIDVFRDSPDFLALYFQVKADMLEQQKKRQNDTKGYLLLFIIVILLYFFAIFPFTNCLPSNQCFFS